MIQYKIVETDNFGGDYPDEKFLALPPTEDRNAIHAIADLINATFCNHEASPRFWKVVLLPYKLEGPFTP
jgi:hypothetical protein